MSRAGPAPAGTGRAGSGRLVLVATPIGHMGELSARAVATLREAGLIGCEDTRRTGLLLQRAGIEPRPPLLRVDDHTERAAAVAVLETLRSGSDVALVTDAGTPGIADPGEHLVAAVLQAGFDVSVVAGPSAAIAALVVSGLPTARWCFEGFLPRKGTERARRLEELADESRTIVLYEAPPRVAATLADLARVLGADRRVAVCRELTKLHEEVWRGTLAGAAERAATREPRGEYVLVLAGCPAREADEDDLRAALRAELASGASRSAAAAAVARRTGLPRRELYELAGDLGTVAPPDGSP